MPQNGGFVQFIDPLGAPYGFSKSEKNICRVELLGGQHIKKSATQLVAKRVIFGKNMFF